MSASEQGTEDTSILPTGEELMRLESDANIAEDRFQHIDASFATIDLFSQSVLDDLDANESLQNGAERDDRDAEGQLKADERAKEDLRKETDKLRKSFELMHSTAAGVAAFDKDDVEAACRALEAALENLAKDNESMLDGPKQRLASLKAELLTKRKANSDLRSQLDEKNEVRARLRIKLEQRRANSQMPQEQLQSAKRADEDLENRKLAATNFIETLNSEEAQSVAAVAAHKAHLQVMRDEVALVQKKTSSVKKEFGEMQKDLESARSSLQQQKALLEETAEKLRTAAHNNDDTTPGADALKRLDETRKLQEEALEKIRADVAAARQKLEEVKAKKDHQKEADWTLRALEEDLASAARKKEQKELEENLRTGMERLEEERKKLDEKRAQWAQREEQLKKEAEEKQKAADEAEQRVKEERRRLSEERQRWEDSQRQQKRDQATREEERVEENNTGPSKKGGVKKPSSKRRTGPFDSSDDEEAGSSHSSDDHFVLGKSARQSKSVFKKPALPKPAAKRGRPPLGKKIDTAGLKAALSSAPLVGQSTPPLVKAPCAMSLPQAAANRSTTPSPILGPGINGPRHSTPLADRQVANHFGAPTKPTSRPATSNTQPGRRPERDAAVRVHPRVMSTSPMPSRAPAPSSSATGPSRSTTQSMPARADPSSERDAEPAAVNPFLVNFLLDDPSDPTNDHEEDQSHFWE